MLNEESRSVAQTKFLQHSKSLGELARIRLSEDDCSRFGTSGLRVSASRPHARMESSEQVFNISSCRRIKARSPSPYSSGMLTLNMLRRQYAMSSVRVVLRCDAHDILLATLKELSLSLIP